MGDMSSRAAADRVRHDLGKYVHLEARWLDHEAPVEELREALAHDLLRTRRGPQGDEDCVQLWARLRPSVATMNLDDIDRLVADAGRGMVRLEALDARGLRELAEVARTLAEACRRLVDQAHD